MQWPADTRAWEVDTLRGHVNNVSCVMFHARQVTFVTLLAKQHGLQAGITRLVHTQCPVCSIFLSCAGFHDCEAESINRALACPANVPSLMRLPLMAGHDCIKL